MRRLLLLLPLLAFPACSKPTAPPPTSTSTSASPSTPPSTSPSASPPADTRTFEVLDTSAGPLRILPIHHGTLLLSWGGRTLYVDPSHEASFAALPKADVVFITDIHPDHLDPEALASVVTSNTLLIVPPSVAQKLPPNYHSVVVIKNGESRPFMTPFPQMTVDAVPMYNLTRGPTPGTLYHDKGRGNGYVITFADKRVYISGDTECTPEMKALKNIDVAFVCMNLPYTMPPTEAAACIKAFRPKIVYPYHYRGSDLAELDKALAEEKGIEVRKRDWY